MQDSVVRATSAPRASTPFAIAAPAAPAAPAASPLRTRHIWTRHIALALALVLPLFLASAVTAGVFDVGSMRADHAEVILDPSVPEDVPASAMLQRIGGVRAVLTPRDLSQLRASVIQEPRVPLPESARRVALIRLGAASRSALVEVFQLQDGTALARELDPASNDTASKDPANNQPPPLAAPPLAAKIRRHAWDAVARTLDPYRAGFSKETFASRPLDTIETGSVWPAPWIIDGDEIDRRFTGRQADRAPASRDLALERFAIHVGPNITAQRPAALLVWLGPAANSTIPEPLAAAAARQGFVVIAPTDIGSTRDLTNRLQLSVDAAYAAVERWHIDPTRVYIGGFSAGGGLANLVWMAFPDVFNGTLMVGGASFYQEVQSGPSAYWPRQFSEPVAANMKRLAGKRSAVIVGENDRARPHMVAVAKRMSLESIRAEPFVVPAIAHEIPSEPYFVQALQWLDADATAEFDTRCEQGNKLLEAAGNARDTAARRRALIAVTRDAPWTPAAWQAVEMLKVSTDSK